MKKKNSTKKKTNKKNSKKKKKKLLKSTEKAIKKKMAPTKKIKYAEDSVGDPEDLNDLGLGDGAGSASNLADNDSGIIEDDLSDSASGKKES